MQLRVLGTKEKCIVKPGFQKMKILADSLTEQSLPLEVTESIFRAQGRSEHHSFSFDDFVVFCKGYEASDDDDEVSNFLDQFAWHRDFYAWLADIDFQASSGEICLLYTSPSPRDKRQSRMPSSA